MVHIATVLIRYVLVLKDIGIPTLFACANAQSVHLSIEISRNVKVGIILFQVQLSKVDCGRVLGSITWHKTEEAFVLDVTIEDFRWYKQIQQFQSQHGAIIVNKHIKLHVEVLLLYPVTALREVDSLI